MLFNYIIMQDNYLIININVKTGLKDNFVKFENNQILLGVKSFPLHNKDNLEVINAILQLFHIDTSKIKIIQGLFNNIKTIRIIDPKHIPEELL
tara:strand:+ start:434 stop:715 length:282 start_codon:yes stop_codon:yes gene_type:complete